jgi:gliding motility-associated-like protein
MKILININARNKSKILCLVGIFFINISHAQLIVASKTLVCPNEATQLKINDKALNPFDFCVTKLNERFGLHYFKTCRQVTVEDAIIMAKMMNGHLATASDEQKNSFLFNLLPNDIHWIGFIQNPKVKNFNDPPNPASGWEWMSKASFARAFWVDGEPNNDELNNPGMHAIQGCRRDPLWCDESGDKKYVGLIESKTNIIPPIISPKIRWETGETTQEITVRPSQSKYYKVIIDYGVYTITDSILIETPYAKTKFSKPGGCNPYKWKPELETNAPLTDLNILWTFGDSSMVNVKNPDFTVYNEGFMTGTVKVLSNACGSELLNKSERFELFPMKDQEMIITEVQLNQEINMTPKNEGPFTYNWSPQTNLSEANIFSPTFTATKEITYQLNIKDDFGCTAKESFKFTIDPDLLIFVPDIFTPNDDNLNNTFSFITVEGFYGEIKKLEIFNNLGEIIHSNEMKEMSWDGKIKEKNAPNGQYLYVITYQIGDKTYKKNGKVMISR